jgi:hypothetical protein
MLAWTLRLSRQCARHLMLGKEFVDYSMELCSPDLELDSWRRLEVHNQIMKLLRNVTKGNSDLFAGVTGMDVGTSFLKNVIR